MYTCIPYTKAKLIRSQYNLRVKNFENCSVWWMTMGTPMFIIFTLTRPLEKKNYFLYIVHVIVFDINNGTTELNSNAS